MRTASLSDVTSSADDLFADLEVLSPGDAATGADEGSAVPVADVSEPVKDRNRPTPHGSKLRELLQNPKLPMEDKVAVRDAVGRYDKWITDMLDLRERGDAKVERLVALLNEYKRGIEMDLIWDSRQDFLFRQRGQLKIDNSVLEEFLPWLVDPAILPGLRDIECFAGPAPAYAAAYFTASINDVGKGIGLRSRTKDQDFTLSRQAYLKASFDKAFPADASEVASVWLAYVAAECKTNLDKTMFQEASATSHDLKVALPGARYYLICEYLDMTPISTAGTDLDEVLILRGKRLASNKRSVYSSSVNRVQRRNEYLEWLNANPVREDVVSRFVGHLNDLINHRDPEENDAVSKGYF